MTSAMKKFICLPQSTIKQAMRRLAEIGEKQVFIADRQYKLLGALSDGDIRKWILKGGSLNENIDVIYNHFPKFVHEHYEIEDVKALMLAERIECVPVVNALGKMIDILVWDHVFAGLVHKYKEPLHVPVVIMAGGKGTRLDPFTRILPKPLIPIGDKPVIEIIMDKFYAYGIQKFFITINHKARMIKSYFEEIKVPYELSYVHESEPLGTAGSLSLLEDKIPGTFILTNSDVLIDADYGELMKFHQSHNYDMTMVVSLRHYVIPYGVCDLEKDGSFKSICEKPKQDLLVNTGMYVLNHKLLKLIPKKKLFNVTDLMEKAKAKGFSIGVFPIHESAWTDVGQWDEYKRAVKMMGEGA